MYREIRDGTWVHRRHRLYRDDIGLVCGHDYSSEAELIIAFIPRIPHKSSGPASKRKRPARPEPRKWSADQAKAVWGDKVRKVSDEEYELKNETYKSGLHIQHLPPASVAIADAPLYIDQFLSTHYLSTLPFYSSVVFRFAQDTIKVGDRVKVLDGEQQGLFGHPIDVSDGRATVILQTADDTTPLLISLRALAQVYTPGDHVKHRYSDSRGIVSAIGEEVRTLTFVDNDTHEEVCTTLLT